ncbi:acyl-CoA thioesterase [Roseovarius sp. SCSIO 43702]|uniref:acyl-CoA thioesterase n=1 Tax=Roseovarius sp. SCSIO 43702 TaxID=2823043 RepID=UPI001C73543F|nr:acyl-CoA thioesterase [Roseovarius sp. SCSIO 43702]QYX56957.1 acyl-CoA thioesterase [Roseovarius sp. SCSIO 43702]
MYPFIRLVWQVVKHRRDARLPLTGTHVSTHYCLPWDIDLWWELNNGRTLTIFDLGRIPLAQRVGLIDVLREKGWGLTVAGSVVRYRRRVRMFDRIEMRSRATCWDERFVYVEQSMWKRNGECSSHALLRMAVTGKNGIVPPGEVMAALGRGDESPEMPEWIARWIAAEDARPWPPMQDAD